MAIQHNLIDPSIHAAVAADGLAREAAYRTTYDDGRVGETRHVLYWDGTVVQSLLAADWLVQRGPLPADPTQAQIDAAILARQQAAQQAQTDAQALRQRVLNTLQSAVGVPFDSLSNAQLRAIVEVLAWQAGALRADTTVRPPGEWVR